MKKWFLSFALVAMFGGLSFGQLIDEKNVTITMDMQPVLQLNMSTPDQIDFVFDDIQEYYGGIIKYGATILKVSASVSWDLYAVGTSQTAIGGAGATNYWDQQMSYSGNNTNAVSDLPLSLLELHQYEANQYDANATPAITDYSTPFAPAEAIVIGQNSIFYSSTPYAVPGDGEKYIQGYDNAVDPTNGAPGGSYLEQGFGTSDYYFTIDYRILPGLPAIFPAAGLNDGATSEALVAPAYAMPGVYTMNVKYILLEDQ